MRRCRACGKSNAIDPEIGWACCRDCRMKWQNERYSLRPTDRMGRKYAGPLQIRDYVDLMEAEREERLCHTPYTKRSLQDLKDAMVKRNLEHWERMEQRIAWEIERFGQSSIHLPPRGD